MPGAYVGDFAGGTNPGGVVERLRIGDHFTEFVAGHNRYALVAPLSSDGGLMMFEPHCFPASGM